MKKGIETVKDVYKIVRTSKIELYSLPVKCKEQVYLFYK